MSAATVPRSLDDVARIYPPAGHVFPKHVLVSCKDALVMFAAGFYGLQDAVWIARAGMTATCLDLDDEKLSVMAGIYPPDWTFSNGDAFTSLAHYSVFGETFDVVTADAPTEMSDRCIDELPLLLSVTKRAAIVSVHTEQAWWAEIVAWRLELPHGWRQSDLVYRTSNYGGCYWLVLERV